MSMETRGLTLFDRLLRSKIARRRPLQVPVTAKVFDFVEKSNTISGETVNWTDGWVKPTTSTG